MAAIVFDNDEDKYQEWLKNNPDGYVLTTNRDKNPDYMSLHLASCRMISQYMKNMAEDAFTCRGYIKICSCSSIDLILWIKKNGGNGFTNLCSICNPDPKNDSFGNLESYFSYLEAEILRSCVDSNGRKTRLKTAPTIPESFITTTTIFYRNPDVIAEVLARANGYCEECEAAAPFNRANDGSPYLEVHHNVPLSKGGEDTVKNAFALCPNCHRKAHFGIKKIA